MTRAQTKNIAIKEQMEMVIIKFGFEDLDYKKFIYKCGLRFLQGNFPPAEGYKNAFDMHARSHSFWNWFKIEYSRVEYHAQKHLNPVFNKTATTQFVSIINHFVDNDRILLQSFNTYIKTQNYETRSIKEKKAKSRVTAAARRDQSADTMDTDQSSRSSVGEKSFRKKHSLNKGLEDPRGN